MYIQLNQEFIPDDELKEHEILRGFYQSADALEIYLSKDGRVWTEVRETFIKPKPSKERYPVFNSLGKCHILHVLLAKTFIRKPKSEKPLEVNHRDGNKNNFTLSNLEWVTRRENVLHAVETGLISKNLFRLLSKDLKTGEVVEHNSLNACARYLGCMPGSVSQYLRRVPTALLKKRYDVTFPGGRWNNFTSADVGRPSLGQRRPVVAFKLEDGSVTIYGSAQDASNKLGINRTEISTRASGKRSSVVKGYKFIWLDEYQGSVEGIPVVSELPTYNKVNRGVRKENPIRVQYRDGRSEVLSGASVLAQLHHVQKSTIQSAIRKNGCFKDIQISYI